MLYIHYCPTCNNTHILNGHKKNCPCCNRNLIELPISFMEYTTLSHTERQNFIMHFISHMC